MKIWKKPAVVTLQANSLRTSVRRLGRAFVPWEISGNIFDNKSLLMNIGSDLLFY